MNNLAVKNIAKAASLFSFTAGNLVLAGWFLHIPAVTTVFPEVILFRISAVLCFLFSGIALYFENNPSPVTAKKKIQ